MGGLIINNIRVLLRSICNVIDLMIFPLTLPDEVLRLMSVEAREQRKAEKATVSTIALLELIDGKRDLATDVTVT